MMNRQNNILLLSKHNKPPTTKRKTDKLIVNLYKIVQKKMNRNVTHM